MKDFMLIFIDGGSYAEMGFSPEQIQERMGKWWAWHAKMEKAGVLGSGNALTNDIRHVSGPDRTVTDISSAELKEIVGGYYIVKANDFEEATDIAQDYPDYDLGGKVEIREVMVFEQ